MYFLPTSLIFIGSFILTLIYIIKNRKTKIERHLLTNELLIALLFLTTGILFPFIYRFHSPNLSQNSLNFLWWVTSLIFFLEIGFLTLTLIHNTIKSKRNSEIMAQRDYSIFCEEFNKNWVDDLKSELGRKLLHLFTCFVIFFFWTLGTILNSLGVLTLWGLDNYSFSYWLIVTVGLGFVIMFQVADLARLNKFYMIPNWAKRWYQDMKQSELHTFVASTPLVLSFIPFLFAPFPILAAVALITTGADAVACLIGKKYGKHPLKTNPKKTVEGFIAGGLTTFIIVLLISIFYHPWLLVGIEKIFLMSLIATFLFLLVDAFTKNISDNILNPILTGFGMWIIFLV
jgi:dolichol kinase